MWQVECFDFATRSWEITPMFKHNIYDACLEYMQNYRDKYPSLRLRIILANHN